MSAEQDRAEAIYMAKLSEQVSSHSSARVQQPPWSSARRAAVGASSRLATLQRRAGLARGTAALQSLY